MSNESADIVELRRVLLEAVADPGRVLEVRPLEPSELSQAARDRAEQRGDIEVGEPSPWFGQLVIASDGGPSIARFDLADASIEIGKLVSDLAAKHGASREEMLEVLAVAALRIAAGG